MTFTSMHRVAAVLLIALGLALLARPAHRQGRRNLRRLHRQRAVRQRRVLPARARAMPFVPARRLRRATALLPQDLRPVCGCNGKTYANDCVRMSAGVSKLHDGKC